MPAGEMMLVFVSIFAPAGQGGIRAYHLNPTTGRLLAAAETPDVPHPFFLAVHPDGKTLYSIRAQNFGSPAAEEVVAWRICDSAGRLEELNRQSSHGSASCFLDVDPTGRAVLVANYTSGDIAALPIDTDGRLGPAATVIKHAAAGGDPQRQTQPHAHAIIAVPTLVHGMLAYVADLGIDQVLSYTLDPAGATLAPATPPFVRSPAAAGPRHLALHPNGCHLYAINEYGNSITVLDRDPGTGVLTMGPTVSTLPEGFTGKTACADVKLTPDGRFLYGTNRGHDSIAIFRVAANGRLELVKIVASGGKGPQNLAITPDGRLLLCANMPGNSVTVFRIDVSSGQLTPLGPPLAVSAPSCLCLLPSRTSPEKEFSP